MTTPEYDPALIEDMMDLQPELATHLYRDGERRKEAAIFMAATFGKMWYVEVKDFTQAGIWRDQEIASKNFINPAEQERIRHLVRVLFLNTEEKRYRDKEIQAAGRDIAVIRGEIRP